MKCTGQMSEEWSHSYPQVWIIFQIFWVSLSSLSLKSYQFKKQLILILANYFLLHWSHFQSFSCCTTTDIQEYRLNLRVIYLDKLNILVSCRKICKVVIFINTQIPRFQKISLKSGNRATVQSYYCICLVGIKVAPIRITHVKRP